MLVSVSLLVRLLQFSYGVRRCDIHTHCCDICSQHIPTTLNHNNLRTEFEYLYQNITNDISHLSEADVIKLKTKLHHRCEKYSDIIRINIRELWTLLP